MPASDNYDSYPPFFRPIPSPSSPPDSIPFIPADSDSTVLPVVNFHGLDPDSLTQACSEWGIFRVINHGIPRELLRDLLDLANQFFSRSFESKQALLTKPMFYFWGSPSLSMSGTAKQTGPSVESRNWLEGLNFPLSMAASSSSSSSGLCFEDDPLLERYRLLLVEYGAHQTRLAQILFNTMADHLKIPAKKSSSYLFPATGFLRVYRYLRCPDAHQRLGIMEHTDSSVLSILHQDQVGGLQVYRNGKWLDVNPVPDTLIVNLGDMMQAMSDDRYQSVRHRVRVSKEKERISVGYFVFPAEDAVIESCVYKPFTYAEFQAKKGVDLMTVGNKIGLPRFRVDDI